MNLKYIYIQNGSFFICGNNRIVTEKFNFHIVVTTHSAHFFEALELYSRKYEIAERCNLLNKFARRGNVFEKCNRKYQQKYINKMVDPALLLSRLREELDTENDKL